MPVRGGSEVYDRPLVRLADSTENSGEGQLSRFTRGTSASPPSSAEELLYDLDGSQRRAVTTPARPLAILAPAGSGKTRVLTRRIAWRVATEDAEAEHTLALTFTRKAARELRTRLAELGLRGGVAAGTFHSIAYAQLRSLWAEQGRQAPALLSSKGPVMKDALGALEARGTLTFAGLAGEVEWAKSRLLGPDDYVDGAEAAQRRPPANAERVAAGYRAYEQVKRRRNMIDFEDLLKLCGDALLNDSSFSAAQRWRFRHLFVDEFQDVNPLQLRLLEAWRGTHLDLCVVGDPQQAIYGWNGADASFLTDFQKLYPPAEVIDLEHNYRSTPQVLNAARHVLHKAKLNPATAQPTQGDGTKPRVSQHATDLDEATAIARALRDHRTPRTAWADQAVLVRTNAQLDLITEALRAARIPHRVRGGSGVLDHPSARGALDMLRWDRRPLAACLPDLDAQLAEEGLPAVAAPGPGAGPGQHPLAVLIELAREHHRVDPYATASGFATWAAATLQAEGADRGGDAVVVSTFHAAKGLEWPVVHLAGLEDGYVPIRHARTTAERAEEARLLYVAMTRALRTLSGTWAARRTFNGRHVERRLCPWLVGLDDPIGASGSGDTSPQLSLGLKWHHQLNEQRRALGGTRPEPSPLLATALAWRERAARAARVEPTTILDDALLEAIVAARPTTHEQLVAVPGMGPLLAERIGTDLLATLDEASKDTNAGSD